MECTFQWKKIEWLEIKEWMSSVCVCVCVCVCVYESEKEGQRERHAVEKNKAKW